MTRAGRRSAAVAVAVTAALALGGCTARDGDLTPGPGAAPATRPSPSATAVPQLVTVTSAPAAPLTVMPEATDLEASLRTSRELFDESPVAVVAPTGDPATQLLAARAAVALGVPLLVGPSSAEDAGSTAGTALEEELSRLGTSAVLVVGDVADLTAVAGEPAAGGGDGEDGGADEASPVVLRTEATAAGVDAVTGLALGAPATTDPAVFAAEVAALVPSTSGQVVLPAPSEGSTADDLTFRRAAPLDDAVALAVDAPEQVAAIATARAAGVAVHLVPATAPNPQATGPVVDALAASPATSVLALGAAFETEPALDWKVRSARGGAQLAGGGQLVFAGRQYVALYGTPESSALGVLGEQPAAAAVQRARDLAAEYDVHTDETVVPTFEIIATVAAGGAGADGNYSNERSLDLLRPWVDEATAAGMYVILDLQPGRSDFLTQARLYEELLLRPNVGLALDPEWRLGPDEVPLQRIGSVAASEVNAVVTWLADLTNAHGLPPKMLVLHQFQLRMLQDRAAIDVSRPELAMVIHVDGQGTQGAKQNTWLTLQRDAPAGVAWGWKNFLDEDLPVLTPAQTMQGVAPVPDLVTYQ